MTFSLACVPASPPAYPATPEECESFSEMTNIPLSEVQEHLEHISRLFFKHRKLIMTSKRIAAEFKAKEESALGQLSNFAGILLKGRAYEHRLEWKVDRDRLENRLIAYILVKENGRSNFKEAFKRLLSLSRAEILKIYYSGRDNKGISTNDGRYFKKEKLIGKGAFSKIYALTESRALLETDHLSCILNHQYAVCRLSHPNIISAFEYVQLFPGQKPCFIGVMKRYYWEGGKLLGNNRVCGKQLISIAASFFEGLKIVHDKMVVHGDIKADNLLLTENPEKESPLAEAVLTDFAFACVPGYPDYKWTRHLLPPEFFEGNDFKSTQTDMWAAICTLFEIAAVEEYPPEIEEKGNPDELEPYSKFIFRKGFSEFREHLFKIIRSILNAEKISLKNRFIRVRLVEISLKAIEAPQRPAAGEMLEILKRLKIDLAKMPPEKLEKELKAKFPRERN